MESNKKNLIERLKGLNITLNKKFYFILLIVIIVIISLILLVTQNNTCDLNYIDPEATDIEGIDISNHQGSINWEEVDKDLVKFVYIKATEGTTYKDRYFNNNWKETTNNGFLKSAYHFYNINGDGKEQAQHFIDVVPKEDCMLPPAVDIETLSDMEAGKVIIEIKEYLTEIEKYYGVKPIIYANIDTYNLYIKDLFSDYIIWFPTYHTDAPAIDNWTFWQYTDQGVLDGFDGPVDLNKFNGKGQDLLDLKLD